MRKLIAALSSTLAYFWLASNFAYAQFIKIDAETLPGYHRISDFLTAAIRLAFIIALIAVLIMLIWGAIEWIFSGGNKDAVGNARNRIIHALVGLAILAIAIAIVTFAGTFVGINILGDLPVPTPSRFAPEIPPPSPQGRI